MKCPNCGTEVFDSFTTQERINVLYQVNNTAGWAKEQIRIIPDMLDDRLLNPEVFAKYPISMNFISKEINRIIQGIKVEG